MASDLLLGIDVGTTTTKATVVSPDGVEVAHGARPTPWRTVATGAEFDAVALADTAMRAVRAALELAPGHRIVGIGVTSMGEAGVLLDPSGSPVTPGVAWYDTRGQAEAARLEHDLGTTTFVAHTGLPVGPAWTIAKIAALRTEGTIRDIEGCRWLSVAEWIARWLGGGEMAELSLASRTGFLDVTTRGWWPAALDWAAIPTSVMPGVVPAGTDIGRATKVRELAGAVVTVAGHDQPCSAVGAGSIGRRDTLDSCGTAEALLRPLPSPITTDTIETAVSHGLTLGWHVLPDRMSLLGFFKGGLMLGSVLRLLGAEGSAERRVALDRQADTASADGMAAFVASLVDDPASMTELGSDLAPGAVWRAAMEAAAHESDRIVTSIDRIAGETTRLVLTGGWARSAVYRAIKREVQSALDYPDVNEAGARGAALFGGLAAGVYASVGDFPRPATRPP